VLFSEIWPDELGFYNKSAKKSQLGDLIWKCYKFAGHEKTVIMLDKLKELGFREATKSGVSIGIDDMIVPKERDEEIEARTSRSSEVEKQYRKGVITPGERYNKIVDIWTHCTDQISSVMFKTLEQNQGKKEYNPVFDGGFRRARQQAAGAAARRFARPHGQAQRRHHRETDSRELPRRSFGAGILHLDARRAQRSGRHRAQDRRLRLHDPQARGRVAGRDHSGGGLRHDQRHLGFRRL
jgi:DNA-directed RNA polymerase beta' subunit